MDKIFVSLCGHGAQILRQCACRAASSSRMDVHVAFSDLPPRCYHTKRAFATLHSPFPSNESLVTSRVVVEEVPTVRSENMRLLALKRSSNPAEIVKIVTNAWVAAEAPNEFSYSLAMNACAQMCNYQQAWELLRRAETTHRITPSEWMWGALLSACVRARRLDEVLKVINSMKSRGVRMNAHFVAQLVDAYGREGDWKGALLAFESHKADLLRQYAGRSGHEKRSLTVCFTTLITALGRGRQWERARDVLLTEMPRESVSPDLVAYGSVMHSCGRARQWREVLALFNHLQSQAELEPSNVIIHFVLHAYYWSDAASWRGAVHLFNDMEQGKYARARPTAPICRTFFKVLGKFAPAAEAHAFYNKLPASYKNLTTIAADVLLAYANEKDGKGALTFLQHLREHGPEPDGICLSNVVLACGRAGLMEDAQALLQEARQSSPFGGSKSACLLDKMSKVEAFEEATAFYSAITHTIPDHPGAMPPPVAMNTGLHVFCNVGDWESAVKVLRQMASGGVQPIEANRASILLASSSAGQWPVATYLLEEGAFLRLKNVGTSGFEAWAQGVEDGILTAFGPALYRQLQQQGLVDHTHKESEAAKNVKVVDFHGLGARQCVCAILTLLQDLENAEALKAAKKRPLRSRSHEQVASKYGTLVPKNENELFHGHRNGRDFASTDERDPVPSIVMVVGRGKHSVAGVSILYPSISKALATPSLFEPPMNARPVPNNPGRIVLSRQEVKKYIDAQLSRR